MIKVYLDDLRPTPSGWTHCYWPSEVIALIEQGIVEVVSLDHDLGDDSRGTGYDVLIYLEERVFTEEFFVPPIIYIHTANPAAAQRMLLSKIAIEHRLKRRKGGPR